MRERVVILSTTTKIPHFHPTFNPVAPYIIIPAILVSFVFPLNSADQESGKADAPTGSDVYLLPVSRRENSLPKRIEIALKGIEAIPTAPGDKKLKSAFGIAEENKVIPVLRRIGLTVGEFDLGDGYVLRFSPMDAQKIAELSAAYVILWDNASSREREVSPYWEKINGEGSIFRLYHDGSEGGPQYWVQNKK